MTWAGAALGVAALALVAGCSTSGAPSSGGAFAPDTSHPAAPTAGAPGAGQPSSAGQADAVPVQKADIIATGSIAVVVGPGSLGHDFALASNDAIAAGGFVASTDTQLSGSSPYADLVLRMPETRFAQVAGELAGLGKVKQESMQGQDVTGQVVDLGARIANLQSEEVALRQLMARTGSIPDILSVENQLFSVQQQVEELTAQKDSLVGQVTYATLTADLTVTPVPAKAQPPKSNAIARGARLAVHNTAAVLHAIALGVGEIFPLLVVGIAAGVVLEVRRRRRRLHPASS